MAGAGMLTALGFLSLQQQSLTHASGDTVEKAGNLQVPCKKVICVGSSVTKGDVAIMGGGIASTAPFPTKLQELLGPGYCVNNYGTSDVTVLKDTSTSFWKSRQLQAIDKLMPDLIFMQFGARDTLENEFARSFQKDYGALIKHFRNLPSRPEVYLISIPPIYPGTASQGHPDKAYGLVRDRVNSLHVPLHRISKENDLRPPISVFNVFRNKCPDMTLRCGWMSKDGVHPSEEGDAIMAGLVQATIVGDDMCQADVKPRISCGPKGASQAQCRDLGCCFSSPLAGPAECFQKAKPVQATPLQCFVTTYEKTACGYHSDSMEQCMSRGCCYKPALDGSPWCYHKKSHSWTPPPASTTTITITRTGTTLTRTMTTITHTATTTTATTATKTGTHTRTTLTSSTTTSVTTTSRTSTSTTDTTTTGTRTMSTSTTSTTTFVSLMERGQREMYYLETASWVKPLLVSVGLLCLSACAWILICHIVHVMNQPQISFPNDLDAKYLQEDDKQRQLRRLEVDMTLRRVEESRKERELNTWLSGEGFHSVNEPRTKKGMFKAIFTYPLHAAVENNDREAVLMLLRAGADVALQDSKRRTAMQLAEQLNKNDSHQAVISAFREG